MTTTAPRRGLLTRPIEGIGALVLGVFEFVGALYWLLHELVGWTWRSIVKHEVRFGRAAFVSQMVRVGFRSISIVILVSGSIGFILALQTAPSLQGPEA